MKDLKAMCGIQAGIAQNAQTGIEQNAQNVDMQPPQANLNQMNEIPLQPAQAPADQAQEEQAAPPKAETGIQVPRDSAAIQPPAEAVEAPPVQLDEERKEVSGQAGGNRLEQIGAAQPSNNS